ncbi:hypothetical protein D3C84_831940 [compost metagenome]
MRGPFPQPGPAHFISSEPGNQLGNVTKLVNGGQQRITAPQKELQLVGRQAVQHHDYEIFADKVCLIVGNQLVDGSGMVFKHGLDEPRPRLVWQQFDHLREAPQVLTAAFDDHR